MMRFRQVRRFLCGASVMVSVLTTVLLLRSPDLLPRSTPTYLRHYEAKPQADASRGSRDALLEQVAAATAAIKGSKDASLGHATAGVWLVVDDHQPAGEDGKKPSRVDDSLKLKGGSNEASQLGLGPQDILRAGGKETSTPPGPVDLSKQGKAGEMLIKVQKQHGIWPANILNQMPQDDLHEQQGDRRPSLPPRLSSSLAIAAVKEKYQEADELWGLMQPVTKKPLLPDSKGQMALSKCAPKHHVFFGKVHKTGSSTVANVLQRYGFTRKLNFVLPRKKIHSRAYNYISAPGETLSLKKLIPQPLGEHYDILWNHGIYDSDFYHDVMPEDTVFVSVLRQPLKQFQSAFEYYGSIPGSYLHDILQTNVSNPLSLYLQNPSKYERSGVSASYIRNKQSQDLGMRSAHVTNATLRQDYIRQLGVEFPLVMLTEFFEESLVLLRRLLCWGVKDVLYLPKNKNPRKKKRVFSDKDVAQHRMLNKADYDLYDFFLKRFNATVAAQGSEFREEVTFFKGLLRTVHDHCLQTRLPGLLEVPASQWSPAFTVSVEDCKMMMKPELPFLDDIMMDAVRRYQKSVAKQPQS